MHLYLSGIIYFHFYFFGLLSGAQNYEFKPNKNLNEYFFFSPSINFEKLLKYSTGLLSLFIHSLLLLGCFFTNFFTSSQILSFCDTFAAAASSSSSSFSSSSYS